MRFFLKIMVAAIAGLILGLAIGKAKAQETVPLPPIGWASGNDFSGHDTETLLPSASECHIGFGKLGRHIWELGSVSRLDQNYFVQLTRTEKYVSKDTSSILTVNLCVVTTRPFRLAEKVRVRHERLVPAL